MALGFCESVCGLLGTPPSALSVPSAHGTKVTRIPVRETGVPLSSQTLTLHIPHVSILVPFREPGSSNVSSGCRSRGHTSVASLTVRGDPSKPITLSASCLRLLDEDVPCSAFFQCLSGVLSPQCFMSFQREVLALISISSNYVLLWTESCSSKFIC